jgi:Uma2 family endonuclease
MSRVRPKIKEYLSIGVQWVWLIDPVKKTAYCYSQADPEGSPCDVLRTEDPAIEIALQKVLTLQD